MALPSPITKMGPNKAKNAKNERRASVFGGAYLSKGIKHGAFVESAQPKCGITEI
jgi:hypothetical protein